MKIQISMLVLSFLVTSHAVGDEETDSMNMSDEVVKVIKKYNGRWKGWSDGCINCDKPLSVTLSAKPKPKTAKKKQETSEKESSNGEPSKQTMYRAPISQGYCECNCKPLKDLKNAELEKATSVASDPENK